MKITIMGSPASGKSFLAREIAKHYGCERVGIGDMRREKAATMGMTIEEYNKYGETHDTDTEVDKFQEEYARTHDNIILDGRMSAYFVPDALKVYVDAEEEVRARRMMGDDARTGESAETLEEAVAKLRRRVESDIRRYEKFYQFNPYNPEAYDVVLDTTHLNKKQAVKELISRIDAFLNK